MTPRTDAGPAGGGTPVVIFIAGSDRSGSTLLDRILGTVDGVFSGGEIHQIFERGIASDELCGCGEPFGSCPVWQSVVDEAGLHMDRAQALELERRKQDVMRLRHIPALLGGRPDLLDAGEVDSVARPFESIYGAIGRVTGSDAIVDSSKHPALAALLSHHTDVEVRVVHLVRDSRAVVHSWSRRKERPGSSSPETEYLDRPGLLHASYIWNVTHLCCEWLRRDAVPVHRIRYEDYVEDPGGEVAGILEFATPGRASGFDRISGHTVRLTSQHNVAGNPMRMKQGEIELRLDDAWRRKMSRLRQGTVSALTAPLLVRYGYLAG